MPTFETVDAAPPAANIRGPPTEDPTRNTRPRVDFSVNQGSNQTPLELAGAQIERHTVSLQDGLSDLLLVKGKEILSLRHKIFSKTFALTKLESHETRIPVSARVAFKLSCMKGVEEEPGFQDLFTRNASLVDTFRKNLKNHIVECGKIEALFMTKRLAEAYAVALSQVVAMFHIAQRVASDKNHPTALRLLADHHATLLKHSDVTTFAEVYTTSNNVGDLSAAMRANFNADTTEMRRAIEAVFISSWDLYLEEHKKRQLVLDLKRHYRETILTEKTEDAGMIVDNELPADREQLQELINKEVSRATAKIQNKTKATAAKNSQRGRKKNNGADKTNTRKTKADDKNKSTTKRKAARKQANRKGKADEQNNAGTSEGRKNTRGRSRSKSNTRRNAKSRVSKRS